MNSVKFEIEIPEEFVKYMNKNEKDYSKKLKQLFLFQFIKEDKISFGKAAELMGVSKTEYIQALGEMGIPYFESDIDDIRKDVNTLDEFLEGN